MPGLHSSRLGLVSEWLVGVGVFSRENGQFPATGMTGSGQLKWRTVYDDFKQTLADSVGRRRLQRQYNILMPQFPGVI